MKKIIQFLFLLTLMLTNFKIKPADWFAKDIYGRHSPIEERPSPSKTPFAGRKGALYSLPVISFSQKPPTENNNAAHFITNPRPIRGIKEKTD